MIGHREDSAFIYFSKIIWACSFLFAPRFGCKDSLNLSIQGFCLFVMAYFLHSYAALHPCLLFSSSCSFFESEKLHWVYFLPVMKLSLILRNDQLLLLINGYRGIQDFWCLKETTRWVIQKSENLFLEV